jgi:exopolysaccharide biosynthesis protein
MPRHPRRPRRPARRPLLAGVLTVALTVVGAGAWALDRFVIEHVEISDVSAYEASLSAPPTAGASSDSAPDVTSGTTSDAVITDTSLVSDDASITISTVTTGSGDATVTYYVADVVLTDATSLRSAFAQNSFGLNITENTSDIAADNGAVFAINGDYYGFRDTGIVIRDGVVYRDEGAREGLAFYRDGTVAVYDETATTADQLVADGVWNTLSFGPALLEGGQVVDGRSPGYSAGVTMTGLAEIMQGLGATTAYNLDGGGSSTMYFNGEVINNPLGKGHERGVSDILYIAG